MHTIIISRAAEKQLSQLPRHIANAITRKIDLLAEIPRPDGCKKLQGYDNAYRIRSGDYRIVYTVEDGKLYIEVIRIQHRRDVYSKK
jgi:mRNA interferase RelE/StbE